MVDSEAVIDALDASGHTALTLAISRGHSELARLLIGRGAIADGGTEVGSSLAEACQGGYSNLVELLLGEGVNVNSCDVTWRTALIGAVGGGHTDLVQRRISAGADVNQVANHQSRTALVHACNQGKIQVARVLLENRTDVGGCDEDGMTGLMLAASL